MSPFRVPTEYSFRLLFGPRKSVRPPLQQISWCAFQCITKLIQDISAVAFAASVKKGMERRVSDAGLLLKFVARPALMFENFLQVADDHVGTLTQKADCVNGLAHI